MEVKINQVVLHLLDPGASEPVLSDRAMDMDADLYEYYTATLERAFKRGGVILVQVSVHVHGAIRQNRLRCAGVQQMQNDLIDFDFHRMIAP